MNLDASIQLARSKGSTVKLDPVSSWGFLVWEVAAGVSWVTRGEGDEVSHRFFAHAPSPYRLLGSVWRPETAPSSFLLGTRLPRRCLLRSEDGVLCSSGCNSAFDFLAFVTDANFIWLASSSNVSLGLVAPSPRNTPRTSRPCSLLSESRSRDPRAVAVKHTQCF